MVDRRGMLGAAAGLAAMALGGTKAAAATPSPSPAGTVLTPPAALPGTTMPLALSGITTEGARTATSIENTKSFPDFIKLVQTCGYQGVHMRASLASLATSLEDCHARAAALAQAGLRVSSVSPDFATPINGPQAADCLRNITPYLTFAEIFKSPMVRVGMKSDADIPFAQRAADEAAERGIRLVHHNEAETMFATVDRSLQTLKAVNRPNFGVIYDEAQLLANTAGYSDKQIIPAVKALAPWIWEVWCKNNRAGPEPGKGAPPEVPIDAKGGVNYDLLFEGLSAIGYKGWLTVHEKSMSYGGDADRAAKACHDFLLAHVQKVTRT